MIISRPSCFLFVTLVSRCSAGLNVLSLLSNITTLPITQKINNATGFVEIATKYGYKTEEHEVKTEDGYILILHRIPPRDNCVKKTPIFMLHGILQTSGSWLGVGEISPGFIVSDDCYDVWFGNIRGTQYGRRHITLDPDSDLEFWKFHVHQIAVYDTPAQIDYILEATGSEKLIYIGYSQGGAAFFIMNSERPEYTSKVSLFIGLSPPTRLLNNRSLLLRTLTVTFNTLRHALEAAGVWEVLTKGFPVQGSLITLCQIKLLAGALCGTATSVLDAPHPESISVETQKRIYENFLAGCSTETLAYYGQEETNANFSKFDYGRDKNLEVYGTPEPPLYDLKASNVPIVIYQGPNDHLVDPADTEWAVNQLPNVLEYKLVDDPLWNHADMPYSSYWKETIYIPMKKYLVQYENKTEL